MEPTLMDVAEEQSLEQMVEAQEDRQALEEDDPELAFDELIRLLADIRVEPLGEEGARPDEFVCRSCQMVMSRNLLGEPSALICIECFVPGTFGF
jgi:hypothetical protein